MARLAGVITSEPTSPVLRPRVLSPRVPAHLDHQTPQLLEHPLVVLPAPDHLGDITPQHLGLALQAAVVRLDVLLVHVVQVMAAPLPQDLWALGIPGAAAAPAVAEVGHDGQRRMGATGHVDDARHAGDAEFVEHVVGRVDGGEDDPVGEEAARDVVEVRPAGAELVAFDVEILAEAVVDFAGGVGSRVLGTRVEPVPVTHDLVLGFFGHAEVPRAVHIGEPDVLKVLVSERHGVEPNVEVEEEDALDLGGAVVGRRVQYQLHGVSEGLVRGESLLVGVVGEVQLVLVGSETWHADVYVSEERLVAHDRRYPFRAIGVDSDKSHGVLER